MNRVKRWRGFLDREVYVDPLQLSIPEGTQCFVQRLVGVCARHAGNTRSQYGLNSTLLRVNLLIHGSASQGIGNLCYCCVGVLNGLLNGCNLIVVSGQRKSLDFLNLLVRFLNGINNSNLHLSLKVAGILDIPFRLQFANESVGAFLGVVVIASFPFNLNFHFRVIG